jgi:hypothetical protein
MSTLCLNYTIIYVFERFFGLESFVMKTYGCGHRSGNVDDSGLIARSGLTLGLKCAKHFLACLTTVNIGSSTTLGPENAREETT